MKKIYILFSFVFLIGMFGLVSAEEVFIEGEILTQENINALNFETMNFTTFNYQITGFPYLYPTGNIIIPYERLNIKSEGETYKVYKETLIIGIDTKQFLKCVWETQDPKLCGDKVVENLNLQINSIFKKEIEKIKSYQTTSFIGDLVEILKGWNPFP